MVTRMRGLKPLDPEKHARFKTATELGFKWPDPQYPINKTGAISNFGMDGNGEDPTLTVNDKQPVGDCGVCAVPAHANMITAVLTGEDLAKNTMTSNEVVTLYFTYQAELAGIDWRPEGDEWTAPHGVQLDNGVDLGDWLLWLFKKGLIDGFVKLELDEMDAALAFDFIVVVGVNLNREADEQVDEGKPWDIGPGDEPDPQEGHAILYMQANGHPSYLYGWCSWGQKVMSTKAWREKCPQQAFAVVAKDAAQHAGFPYSALIAHLRELGGQW